MTLALLVAAAVQAQDGQQAALVVRFSDERVEQLCVSFTEPEITGQELLERSGLAFELLSSGMGSNVCSVEDVGCSSDNCFCQCQGGDCVYWSYWRLQEDGWRYSGIGAHASTVTDGSVEGWSWGPGSVNQAISPPPVTFEEVCAASEEGAAGNEADAASENASAGAAEDETAIDEAEGVAMTTPEAAVEPVVEDTQQSGQSYLLFGAIVAGLLVLLLLGSVARRR